MKKTPTCSRCGVPTIIENTLCAECVVDTLMRVAILRDYLVRTMDDPKVEWPVTHRPLS